MLYDAASIKKLRKRLIAYEEQKSRRTKSVAKSARVEKNNVPVNVEVRERRVATTAVMKNMCVQSARTSRRDLNVSSVESTDTSHRSATI